MTTKAELIKAYNTLYPTYNITNIKKMTQGEVDYYKHYGSSSLDELYKRPSYAKLNSWDEIVRTYEPQEVLGFVGNSMTYSVMLIADNGDLLHITRGNNWLVEVA